MQRLKILIVKLSSLGDVLHTLPVVHDIKANYPEAQIDWVVEKSFAGILQRCEGVNKVITCELRKWRKAPLSTATRQAWGDFKADLQSESYDAVVDLQGLTKSGLVSWLATLSPQGKRYAMANRTDGSSYESPTRWPADRLIPLTPHLHAVARARAVCAGVFGYRWVENALIYPKFNFFRSNMALASNNIGLLAIKNIAYIVFAHGSSREDKLWPVEHWVALGQHMVALGFKIALAHGSDEEESRSFEIAKHLENAVVNDVVNALVLPRLGLEDLLVVLNDSAGVVGVDSGVSHMAVALNLPHVQIYNFDTAWRTGPVGFDDPEELENRKNLPTLKLELKPKPKQISVYAVPTPTVDAVWQAWQRVSQASMSALQLS
jgi:heptosyltransferase-1